MVDDPLLRWAQRSAGLRAVLSGLTGIFLTMAVVSFSRQDAWGMATIGNQQVNAWPFLGGGLMLGVTLAVAVAIFVFAYRLTGALAPAAAGLASVLMTRVLRRGHAFKCVDIGPRRW